MNGPGRLPSLPWRALAPVLALVPLALLPLEGAWGAALRAGAVLGALALAAAALRRAPGPERQLRLLDRQPLSREAGVALVAGGGRSLLVGYAPGGVEVLADLGREEAP